jgi:hypothetical protein
MSKASDKLKIEKFVKDCMLKEYSDLDNDIAIQFVSKALESGVISKAGDADLTEWFEKRFKPYLFILDENEYTQAAIQALRIQFGIQGTDFGSSRQRDMGQKWTDTIRGYLGELGFKQVMKSKFNIDINLGHAPGKLEDYLPLDIHGIRENMNQEYRKPNINISIKTIKSNGIWLDIPGNQFAHSDIHLSCSIGIDVDHLFGFFKHLSVFQDKILKRGLDLKIINQGEADEIYNKVPSFKKVYGYIPGFVNNTSYVNSYVYDGKLGRKNYLIKNWTGKYELSYLDTIKKNEGASKVQFAGIGEFTQSSRHLFGLKSLKHSDLDWKNEILQKI